VCRGYPHLHVDGVDPGYLEASGVLSPVGQLVIVYMDDVDTQYARVVSAGIDAPQPQDEFYGARVYTVKDLGGRRGLSASTSATRSKSLTAGRSSVREGELTFTTLCPPGCRKVIFPAVRHGGVLVRRPAAVALSC
jgi:hypothetical protein